jgi:hypothetical protein
MFCPAVTSSWPAWPVEMPSSWMPLVRARFEQLRGNGIVELNGGAYRATHIALYSSYRLPAPPIPALTNEWGRSTDINRESH